MEGGFVLPYVTLRLLPALGCAVRVAYISNWQGTIYDLSEAVEADVTQRVGLCVTPDEYKLLTDIITSSQEEDAIISGAVSTSEGVRLSGREGDFDQLLGSIAFDINHCENTRRERILGTVYDRIQELLEGT